MSDWSDRGFPSPDKDGYGYDLDAGLLRTRQQTAKPRQSRMYATNKRTFTLTVTFGYALLTDIENFLYERGFNWFTIDLVSGEDTSVTEPVVVRLVEFYTVTNKGKGEFQVSFKVEQKIHRSYYATSVLYPLENFEYSVTAAPTPMTVHFWQQVRHLEDWTSSVVPTIVSASLDQTVFHPDPLLPGPFPWDYTGHGWGRNVDLDAVVAMVPVINVSLDPFLLNLLSMVDSASTACPVLSAVDFSQTVFHAYVFQDDYKRGDKTITEPPALVPMTLEQTIFLHSEAGQDLSGAAVPGLQGLLLAQTVFRIQASQAGDLRSDRSSSSSPSIGVFSIERSVIRRSNIEYSVVSAPVISSLWLVHSVNRPTETKDYVKGRAPALGGMSLSDTVFRVGPYFDLSGSVAPTISAMSMMDMTHHLENVYDYASAHAPMLGAFALVDMRGSVKVTVLRSVNGEPVVGAKVELS